MWKQERVFFGIVCSDFINLNGLSYFADYMAKKLRHKLFYLFKKQVTWQYGVIFRLFVKHICRVFSTSCSSTFQFWKHFFEKSTFFKLGWKSEIKSDEIIFQFLKNIGNAGESERLNLIERNLNWFWKMIFVKVSKVRFSTNSLCQPTAT